jgi:hemin uptake protein HemP
MSDPARPQNIEIKAQSETAGSDPIATRRIAVPELMQGARQVILVHDGSDYVLRVTANSKLILTK